MLDTEEPLRAGARDLSDPTHSRRSLRAAQERRARLARRRRTTSGGRRVVVAAMSVLALGAGGAVASESGGSEAGAPSVKPQSSAVATTSASTIKAVQRKLGVTVDGAVGPRSRAALKRWQRRNGLPADGRITAATLAKMGISAVDSSAPERKRTPGQTGSAAALLERIAECESGGDPTAVSPDGRYRGKYQFLRSTWESLGGEGDPAKASEAEQDLRAAALMERQGPSAWPTCSKRA